MGIDEVDFRIALQGVLGDGVAHFLLFVRSAENRDGFVGEKVVAAHAALAGGFFAPFEPGIHGHEAPLGIEQRIDVKFGDIFLYKKFLEFSHRLDHVFDAILVAAKGGEDARDFGSLEATENLILIRVGIDVADILFDLNQRAPFAKKEHLFKYCIEDPTDVELLATELLFDDEAIVNIEKDAVLLEILHNFAASGFQLLE